MPTYSPSDAVTFARNFVKGIPVTAVDSQVCDIIQSEIYDWYPFEFTRKQKLKVNDAFLTDKAQDLSGVPTDFMRLLRARLKRTDLTDGNYQKDLTIAQHLEPANPSDYQHYSYHEYISYEPEISKFRLQYKIQIVTGETTELDIEYQKTPTKITDSNLSTAFSDMSDWFFPVFSSGVLWMFMVLANDRRQGQMQITKDGTAVYTGQMGVYYNALITRAHREQQRYAVFHHPAGGSLGSAY